MPGVLVLISVILFIAAYVLYDKRDETEGAKYSKRADDLLINVSSVESQATKIREEQKNFATNTVTALADITGRISALENKSRDINLNLEKPLQVSIVYKTVLPTAPTLTKGKTPLLDKAGVTKAARMNN